jgi:hypothetical protein
LYSPGEGWTAADIDIVLDDDMTDGPVTTVRICTPAGELTVMAEVSFSGRELFLARTRVQAENMAQHSLGPARLRQIASAVAERLDVYAITIGGAVRTSGAGRGRLPRPVRFSRKLSA